MENKKNGYQGLGKEREEGCNYKEGARRGSSVGDGTVLYFDYGGYSTLSIYLSMYMIKCRT